MWNGQGFAFHLSCCHILFRTILQQQFCNFGVSIGYSHLEWGWIIILSDVHVRSMLKQNTTSRCPYSDAWFREVPSCLDCALISAPYSRSNWTTFTCPPAGTQTNGVHLFQLLALTSALCCSSSSKAATCPRNDPQCDIIICILYRASVAAPCFSNSRMALTFSRSYAPTNDRWISTLWLASALWLSSKRYDFEVTLEQCRMQRSSVSTTAGIHMNHILSMRNNLVVGQHAEPT